jgi:hypothetical protein
VSDDQDKTDETDQEKDEESHLFDEVEVNGERGLWTNKSECINWKGPVPLEKYSINYDPDPEVITKRCF